MDALPAAPQFLRIASLLPSTTEIVGALGLASHVVAVSHECDLCPDGPGLDAALRAGCVRVTTSDIDPSALSQGAIDERVSTALRGGLSLYAIREDLFRDAAPTVVLTQALCDVCAPSADDVIAACSRISVALPSAPRIHSFEPETLDQVARSLEDVGAACGVPERGALLRAEFNAQLDSVRRVAGAAAAASGLRAPPRLLLLEWLDPPFDGGSWIIDMCVAAATQAVPCRPAQAAAPGASLKSLRRTW